MFIGSTVVATVKIQRVKVNRQGYDRGGRYWGVDAPLFYFTLEQPYLTETGYFRCSDYQSARQRYKALGHHVER
jgi:hypothetical protein